MNVDEQVPQPTPLRRDQAETPKQPIKVDF
jgi:hypothetical protein